MDHIRLIGEYFENCTPDSRSKCSGSNALKRPDNIDSVETSTPIGGKAEAKHDACGQSGKSQPADAKERLSPSGPDDICKVDGDQFGIVDPETDSLIAYYMGSDSNRSDSNKPSSRTSPAAYFIDSDRSGEIAKPPNRSGGYPDNHSLDDSNRGSAPSISDGRKSSRGEIHSPIAYYINSDYKAGDSQESLADGQQGNGASRSKCSGENDALEQQATPDRNSPIAYFIGDSQSGRSDYKSAKSKPSAEDVDVNKKAPEKQMPDDDSPVAYFIAGDYKSSKSKRSAEDGRKSSSDRSGENNALEQQATPIAYFISDSKSGRSDYKSAKSKPSAEDVGVNKKVPEQQAIPDDDSPVAYFIAGDSKAAKSDYKSCKSKPSSVDVNIGSNRSGESALDPDKNSPIAYYIVGDSKSGKSDYKSSESKPSSEGSLPDENSPVAYFVVGDTKAGESDKSRKSKSSSVDVNRKCGSTQTGDRESPIAYYIVGDSKSGRSVYKSCKSKPSSEGSLVDRRKQKEKSGLDKPANPDENSPVAYFIVGDSKSGKSSDKSSKSRPSSEGSSGDINIKNGESDSNRPVESPIAYYIDTDLDESSKSKASTENRKKVSPAFVIQSGSNTPKDSQRSPIYFSKSESTTETCPINNALDPETNPTPCEAKTSTANSNKGAQTDICLQHFGQPPINPPKNLNLTLKTNALLKAVSMTVDDRSAACNLFVEINPSPTDTGSPLDTILGLQQSSVLMDDIDTNLEALRVFMQSKKYNKVVKKYYFNKIMRKIMRHDGVTEESGSEGKTDTSQLCRSDDVFDKSGDSEKAVQDSSDVTSDPSGPKSSTGEELTAQGSPGGSNMSISPKSDKSDKSKSKKHLQKMDELIKQAQEQRKAQLSNLNDEITYLHKCKELLVLEKYRDTMKSVLKLIKSTNELCDNPLLKINRKTDPLNSLSDGTTSVPSVEEVRSVTDEAQERLTEERKTDTKNVTVEDAGRKTVATSTDMTNKKVTKERTDDDYTDLTDESTKKISTFVTLKTKKSSTRRMKIKFVRGKCKSTECDLINNEGENPPNRSPIEKSARVSKATSTDNNEDFVDKENVPENADNKEKRLTLQEYLRKNKPDFIESANWRRNTLKEIMTHRKVDPNKENYHLFSNQQVREISKKIYNKLPEAQKKITLKEKRQQKVHNKIVADVFSKNLQRKTLEGKVTLPITTRLIKS